MVLALGACLAEGDGRPLDGPEDRELMPVATELTIVQLAAEEPGNFALEELLEADVPTGRAKLGADPLAEISRTITQEAQTEWFALSSTKLEDTISSYNHYARDSCISGRDDEGQCSNLTLNESRTAALGISAAAQSIYQTHLAWSAQEHVPEDVATDIDWQVFLSSKIRIAIAIDLAMRREVAEIEQLLGDHEAQESWEALQVAAHEYRVVLKGIEARYHQLNDKFGNPEIKEQPASDGTGNTIIRACFDAPGGVDCNIDGANSYATVTCNLLEQCQQLGPTNTRLIEDARDRVNLRKKALKKLALGSEEKFARLVAEVLMVATLDIEGIESLSCGFDMVSFDGHDPGQSTGTYRRTDTYNEEPVYTFNNGIDTWSVYKRLDIDGASNWVLDVDDVSEEWTGTVAHTTNSPATPWSGIWTQGNAHCVL